MVFMASLLLLKNGSDELVPVLFQRMVGIENLHDVEKQMVEAFVNGELIAEFKTYTGLTFFSAYYLIMGKYHFEVGYEKGGMDCLKAAVSHDPGGVLTLGPHWAVERIRRLWTEDKDTIRTLLYEENVTAAEDLIGEWESAKTVLPDYDVVVSQIIAIAKNRESALSFMMSRISENKENPDLLAHGARLLFDSGYFEDASRMVRLAANSDPVFATIWEDMGDVFYERKDDPRALDCYEQCFSVLPERLEVLRKIGDLYRRMGKMESAIMAYEAVLQSNPAHSLAACGLDEIRKGL